MLAFLTLLMMLGVCYAYWREGLLTACCMFVNVLLAGLVAFCLWEPAADFLVSQASFLEGYEDCLCLVLLFSVALGLLRMATNSLAFTDLDYPLPVLRSGGVFFGLMTGYLVAGFLLCAFQTLPLTENFLGFDSRIEPDQPKTLRSYLPPDRVWLAMMHRAGLGPFSWGEKENPKDPDYRPTFDPNGNFELRYARYRRKEADKTRKDDGALSPR